MGTRAAGVVVDVAAAAETNLRVPCFVSPIGGFHPDHALAWKDGDAAYEVLVCFGCKEVKLYGRKTKLLVDIAEEAIPRLEALLKKHQQARPTRG